MTLALPGGLDVLPQELLPLLQFAASPLSGVLMGAVGPVVSPVVEIGNSIGEFVGDLTGGNLGAALTGLLQAPADVVGSFFNGATLNLDFVLPLISGSMPDDMSISSLSLAFGGLLSGGSTYSGALGGSMLNSLGMDASLGAGLASNIEGQGIGPISALSNLSQIIASTLGWDSVAGGNPLTDLVFPTLDFGSLFSDLSAGGFGLDGLLGGLGGNLSDLLGYVTSIPELIIAALMGAF